MKYKSITIINDCASPNDKGRQMIRYLSIFGITPEFIGLHNYSEIEAAGEIIDALDAVTGYPGIIAINSAPRHGGAKKWPNGSPFGFLEVDGNLIVTTIDGYTLSLLKKLKLATKVNVTDIKTVLNSSEIISELDEETRNRIVNTQFRSFEYLPRLAHWLSEEKLVPSEEYSFDNISDLGKQVWYIDSFGNCKTTILPEEIEFENGKEIATNHGNIKCYERLKDVPNGETALIVGSSGYKDNRFIELIIQGKSAANELNINIGDILIE
ncbi:SAM-dependent chlorinase/fluorinase [Candidatus Dojkabacteria bacterium]|nr:SAM-dependent chlorinase/fluorinase [Candidatus Dojkabacteria bacterium]